MLVLPSLQYLQRRRGVPQHRNERNASGAQIIADTADLPSMPSFCPTVDQTHGYLCCEGISTVLRSSLILMVVGGGWLWCKGLLAGPFRGARTSGPGSIPLRIQYCNPRALNSSLGVQ